MKMLSFKSIYFSRHYEKGREDLAEQTRTFLPGSRQVPLKDSVPQNKAMREEEDGMEYLDKEVSFLTVLEY